ncbi:hypothetical protein [Nocardiopsis sp. JB363]|uniref:hypothetical protein n=1 Tax=Nocardiopsis sp. JB363 TaxID=1434837 RepID=UPI00097AF60F|nr:hypothetical protein [Nocardiopsis sp. JB363]SIO86155.1 hypothetical protein BQ8420_10570 [Nocardiopsis sp. JB363]
MTTTTAARFSAVAATLTAMHHAGDYLFQTDHQATHKAGVADRATECSEDTSWRALAAHVASYHAAQAAGLLIANRFLGLRLQPSRVVAGVAVSAATHALIDRRWPVRWWMDHTGSSGFRQAGGAAHADQALHHLALWASALVIASDDQ